jgi:hypothetical protein
MISKVKADEIKARLENSKKSGPENASDYGDCPSCAVGTLCGYELDFAKNSHYDIRQLLDEIESCHRLIDKIKELCFSQVIAEKTVDCKHTYSEIKHLIFCHYNGVFKEITPDTAPTNFLKIPKEMISEFENKLPKIFGSGESFDPGEQ